MVTVTTNIMEEVVAALRQRRISLGYTQMDLYRKTGISNTTISEYELCKVTPDLATVVRIAAALNWELQIHFLEN